MGSRLDFLSPIHLTDTVTMPGSGASYDQTLNPVNFLNPNKTGMLVDELRFTPWANINILGTRPERVMALVNIDLRLGPIPLTNAAIPFFSLFPRYLGEADALTLNGAYPGTAQSDAGWTWHLPRPMYVPRDLALNVRLQSQTAALSELQGTFSMIGRSVSDDTERPKTILVPWATGFRVPSTVTNYVTLDSQMANSFRTKLNVTSFLGYDLFRASAGGFGDVMVQMTRSSNRMLVRDPTPFRLLFPVATGLLQMAAVLEPNDFVRVELTAPTGANNLDNVCVGMTGFREVDTPGVP